MVTVWHLQPVEIVEATQALVFGLEDGTLRLGS